MPAIESDRPARGLARLTGLCGQRARQRGSVELNLVLYVAAGLAAAAALVVVIVTDSPAAGCAAADTVTRAVAGC